MAQAPASSEAAPAAPPARLEPWTVHVLFVAAIVVTLGLATRSSLAHLVRSVTGTPKATSSNGDDAYGKTLLGAHETLQFRRFQRLYLTVYFFMVAGDWLQGASRCTNVVSGVRVPIIIAGPYMYALYADYGYSHDEIAALFVAGFGASAVFGTFVGSVADTIGRKRGALVYAATYVLSCLTKHWKSFSVLMVGRILGGIATSLLFSVFDAWLVAEYAQRGHDPAALATVFANAQAGNSAVAIAAGVLGELAAGATPLRPVGGADSSFFVGGYTAPFDAASACLVVGAAFVATTWSENYGSSAASASSEGSSPPAEGPLLARASTAVSAVLRDFGEGALTVARDRRVLLVGLVSACFEAAMYAFVFEWTPALTVAGDGANAPKPPYGEIFSAMMVCCALGTRVFVGATAPPDRALRVVLGAACAAMALPALYAGLAPTLCLVAFLGFEVAVGCYFPAIGVLKSQVVADAHRATVYNLYRVPLNALVLAVLLARATSRVIFCAAFALLVVALALQHRLCVLLGAAKPTTSRDHAASEGLLAAHDAAAAKAAAAEDPEGGAASSEARGGGA